MNQLDEVLLTPSMDHMAKVIFVISYASPAIRYIFRIFYSLGFYNVIILFTQQDQVIIKLCDIDFNETELKHVYDPDILFFDKLKDMKGKTYKVLAFGEDFKDVVEIGVIKTPMASFLKTVADKQNARIKYFNLLTSEEYDKCYTIGCMDLIINSAISAQQDDPRLLTYEETGHCALIPRSNSQPFKLIFFRPFGWKIWTAFFGSLLATALTWRLFKNRETTDSSWKALFGILAYFLGQSISFRKNHLVLLILLQIFIFMTMILSSLYTGELTAIMIESAEELKLHNFDELFESDFKFMVDEYFDHRMQKYEGYAKIKHRVIALIRGKEPFDPRKSADERIALILYCDFARKSLKSGENSKFYYLLDQQILKDFVQLDARFINPYVERLQLYMDWSFETGLPQAWKMFLKENIIKEVNEVKERQFLELDDMGQVFLILFIGLLSAVIVLLMEILYHKFGENLHMHWIYLKDEIYLRRLRRRNLRLQRRNLRLRKAHPTTSHV